MNSLMDIFFFIIIAIAFIYQGNRIGKLENIIKNGNKILQKPQVQPVSASSITTPETMASPVTSAPNQPTISNVSLVKPDISNEEMSGRIIGRIGIGAVIIGIAFFLKYAFDNNWVGPSGRVMIGILIGMALLGIGQWLQIGRAHV